MGSIRNGLSTLYDEIKTTLHSRELHRHAWVIYNNTDIFSEVKRAWATWVLCCQSFGSMIDGGWGYDITGNTMNGKLQTKVENFTKRLVKRLKNCQLECTDALKIIKSRDHENSFFYCDPPYFNSDMGHYDGYSEQDFENPLALLAKIKGKFLLSAYPFSILAKYVKQNEWVELAIISQ